MSPGFTVWNGPERINFVEGSLPWRFNTVNLKGVSHGEWKHYVIQCRGLERSQFEQFCAVYEHRVLKWVNFGDKSQGSWKESRRRGCVPHTSIGSWNESNFAVCVRVLKWVNMHQFSIFLQRVLKGVQCIVLKACLALALVDLSSLYGARGDISCNKAESLGVSPLSMSWGLMKAGSD